MLIRAAIVTNEEKYVSAIHKAKDFMLKPISSGGTTEYDGEDVIFYEFTNAPIVLNGWIFSLWGLYDYVKYTKDDSTNEILQKTLSTLKKKLPDFDNGYWSKYDAKKRISSPFYHRLHIAQLKTLYDLFGDEEYKRLADKWESYQNSFWKSKRAFCKKAIQKVFER